MFGALLGVWDGFLFCLMGLMAFLFVSQVEILDLKRLKFSTMRLHYLFLSLCMCAVAATLSAQSSRPGAWRVDYLPGSSRLSLESLRTLVVPAGAGDSLSAAVEDLRHVFERRTGVALKVQTAGANRPKSAIYLGDSGGSRSQLQNDAFMIHRQGTRVFVAGDGERGVLNGVYALCQELLGARWYWAGDLGLELVGSPPGKFPEGRWHEEPAYVMRTFYPMNGEFGRRNRLVRHFQFNHALAKVFTPALYDAEPEIFSEVYGRRRKPTGSGGYDPQPDFTERRAVEVAAKAALAAFEKNPESRSFSLSINDNALFDDSEATRRAIEPVEYFRGRPNYTDLVFGFMNQVAEQVFEEGGAWTTPAGEPRYLTALAYYWTEQSPSFSLHPRVMPVLTSDRAQWHDSEYRAQDKALIQRWADSGADRLATWDYYFGAPYVYPRQFNQWIAESLKYMSANGVSVFFSQLPSSWGLDGCKAWLAAELLWNPDQDAAALLDEYYTHFFGAAAVPLRAFYEEAEAHRNANEGKAEWIKFYEDEFGIELFDAARLRGLRDLIESGKALVADDPRRLARIEVVSEAFRMTELFAQYHATRVRLIANGLDVLSDRHEGIPNSLPKQLRDFIAARTAFDAFSQELLEDPIHARLHSFTKYSKLDPVAFALAAMAQAGVAIPSDDDLEYAAVAEVAQRWGASDGAFHSKLSNVDLQHEATAPKARNFLGPELPKVPGWHFDFRPAEHLAVGVVSEGQGIRVMGADVFSIFRDIPVISGQRYLLDARMAYQISPDNRSQVNLSWRDLNGDALQRDMLFRCPTGSSDGVRRVVLPICAPERAYTMRLRFFISRQYEGDFLDLHNVDFGLIAK